MPRVTAALGCPCALALTQDWLPTIIGRWFPLHNAGVLAHVADRRGCGSIWHILMGKESPQLCPNSESDSIAHPSLTLPSKSKQSRTGSCYIHHLTTLSLPAVLHLLSKLPLATSTQPHPGLQNTIIPCSFLREPSVSHTVISTHPSPHRTPLRQSQSEPRPALECPHDHC